MRKLIATRALCAPDFGTVEIGAEFAVTDARADDLIAAGVARSAEPEVAEESTPARRKRQSAGE